MSLTQILILAVSAILIGRLKNGRSLAMLIFSALVIFWLQPVQEPVSLMFWMPVLTLGVVWLAWVVTADETARSNKGNFSALFTLAAVVVIVGMNRYLRLDWFFTSETPRLQWILPILLVLYVAGFFLLRTGNHRRFFLIATIIGLIALLILVKMPSVLVLAFNEVSELRGKQAGVFTGVEWLGFSYVTFRLLHTVLDRLAGRLPSVGLREYVAYVIFFPSFTAGPIDRIERFLRDLNQPLSLDQEDWVFAGRRLFVGLFKKFVIADPLAWIALNETFARDTQFAGYLWIMLYAYSLRLYFDFSGYTDIAIGLGRFMGIKLPENFDSPYLKPNLTLFWNSWHMTLTQWFRSYFFNPLTRRMRSMDWLPPAFSLLLAQISTMILIGLWHGYTVNYVVWGAWHGVGLFIQNRWSNLWRPSVQDALTTPSRSFGSNFIGAFLTFHFVSLGWLFFVFPDANQAWFVFLRMFGIS